MKRAADAFSSCQACGLFALAASNPDTLLPPSLSFWRDFASCYLTLLCRTPESAGAPVDPVDPPGSSEIEGMLFGAPPMQGGEYLNALSIQDIWIDLDEWVRREISLSGTGLTGWLKKHAPMWQQVGRVCFHLAENKRDSKFPFAFLATYAPKLSRGGRVQYQPLGKALQEYAGQRNKKTLISLLSPVQAAAEKSNFMKNLVDSRDVFHPLAWSPKKAYQFLRDVPLFEKSGLIVRLPDWWQRRPRPRVVVTMGEKKQSRLGMNTMLDFRVEVALGEERLTEAECHRLMESEEGLVNLRGKWVEIDGEKLSEALAHWKRIENQAGKNGISFIEGMRLLAGAPSDMGSGGPSREEDREWAFINAGNWLSGVLAGLRNPETLASADGDKNFHGTLRPYQAIGHNWLQFLSSLGLGACLADDMGLGKTIQVLSLLVSLKERRNNGGNHSLLVLPASLLGNWRNEIKRFAPTLEPCFVHPSETDKTKLALMAQNPSAALEGKDIVLTTYGMILRQKWLLDMEWGLVILDEAQAIKNPGADQTRAVKKLKADAKIALTGTPVENRLGDLWSIFDFLCPGLLGSARRFKDFSKALERREQDRYGPLRRLVQPYILRRLKTDKSIIADLPDKTEVKTFCGLTKKQAALYARSVEDLARALKGLEGIKRRGLVLSYLLRFKQICNHPSQLLGDRGYDPRESGKYDRLRAICEEISSRQEKVLIFTQFREMTEPVAIFLTDIFGREGLVLHGGTPVKKRKNLIQTFEREEGPPFFVLSLKAGGTGLNLTAASHVIHFDRWWNPAVENQATDRAFRIGQKKNVLVHKFICRGTVEEKIDELMEEKKELSDGILKAGAESMLTEMSDKELIDLVALDIDRAEM
ncbi:MAG: DEAD/DEAH box helicase [Deltaproteobacteria bacterium]|nr:DEAD/DEAH box helicase [Deltaproteobacteria bacterium]